MLETILRFLKKIFPKKIFKTLQPLYHFSLALLGAIIYWFPSNKLQIIGITGTKGKSSVSEILNHVLESNGYSTAMTGTISFKIGKKLEKNKLKQTMPGRFFLQKFLSDARKEKIDWTIVEMTSEGAKQFRNYFIKLNAFIFTNIALEHLESHGGFENYKQAKLSIIKNSLEKSKKKDKILIVNKEDKYSNEFIDFDIKNKFLIGKHQVSNLKTSSDGVSFLYKKTKFSSPLPGYFSFLNIISVITFCEHIGIQLKDIAKSLQDFKNIPGRNEEVQINKDFRVIVDYAHTLNSMEAVYQTYKNNNNLICVFGSCGGGRDKWVRPEKAKLAAKYCREIILTDEDPYDDDPYEIIEDIKKGLPKNAKYMIEIDRAKAIKKAIQTAKKGDVILILAKGVEPYIMRANGKKEDWSDKQKVLDAVSSLK